jgi:hypothetical protein
MPNEHYVSKPFDKVEDAETWAKAYEQRNWGYCPRYDIRKDAETGLYVVHVEQWHSCD